MNRIVACIIVVVTIGLVVIAWPKVTAFFNQYQREPQAPAMQPVERELDEQRYSRAILNYAAQPMFSSRRFLEELTGAKVTLQRLDLNEGWAYFSLPSTERPENVLVKITPHPTKAEFAKLENNRLVLGGLALNLPGSYFFRIRYEHFMVDPKARLHIPFSQVTYDPSVEELAKFLANSSLALGKKYFVHQPHEHEELREYRTNFGAYLVKPGEPSFTRLAKAIVGTETNRSRICQKLLDFVTNEVEYDYDEEEWSNRRQVIRRPNESLMTRKATCASKAILYASLLRQFDIDFWLAYYPLHLTVFVGEPFVATNGCTLMFDKKEFHLAETTCPGFVIGRDELEQRTFRYATGWEQLHHPRSGTFFNRNDPGVKRLE